MANGIPGDDGTRVLVEVLNTTRREGLARTGTRVLRARGIDVVAFGSTSPSIDSTRILVLKRDRAVGERVRRALGIGVVEMRPDTAALLDARVLLGADFAPPLGFHP